MSRQEHRGRSRESRPGHTVIPGPRWNPRAGMRRRKTATQQGGKGSVLCCCQKNRKTQDQEPPPFFREEGKGLGHGSLGWRKVCSCPCWRGALPTYRRAPPRVPLLGFLQSGDTQASMELNSSLTDIPWLMTRVSGGAVAAFLLSSISDCSALLGTFCRSVHSRGRRQGDGGSCSERERLPWWPLLQLDNILTSHHQVTSHPACRAGAPCRQTGSSAWSPPAYGLPST